MGDRIIVVLPDGASDADRRAAVAAGAHEVVTMSEWRAGAGAIASHPDLPSFTAAERGVLMELAHRPDTRSRLAHRLGISTSTLDNQLASIKRKVLDSLATSGNAPVDGYLSTEALIGWAMRNLPTQES